jgi:hypothetical protein
MTDEQIAQIAKQLEQKNLHYTLIDFARAILQAASATSDGCTEPDRASCPRLCIDFCNKAEREAASATHGDPEKAFQEIWDSEGLSHVEYFDGAALEDMFKRGAEWQAASAAPTTDQIIDAANERAALYDGDDRECIKTDVMNAFYAGVEFARQAASAAPVADPVKIIQDLIDSHKRDTNGECDESCEIVERMEAARDAIAAAPHQLK